MSNLRPNAVAAADRVLSAVHASALTQREHRLSSAFARLAHDVPPAFLRPGDHAVVAGVWSARTAGRYAKAVGPRGRVLVVEASPERAAELGDELRSYRQVEVVSAALWGSTGSVEFFAAGHGEYAGFNRVAATGLSDDLLSMVEQPRTIEVACVSLDSLLEKLDPHMLRKVSLTINGSEIAALEGASSLYEHARDVRTGIWSEFPKFGPEAIRILEGYGQRTSTTFGRQARLRWGSLDLRYILGVPR